MVNERRAYATSVTVCGVALKFQFRLFPASTLPALVSEFQIAPPVALMSWMVQKLTLTVPDASVRVARAPTVELLSVIWLPLVPETLNALTVVIVLAGNVIVAGCTVLAMLAKVFAPLMANAPAPPWARVPNDLPPPANVLALALVIVMVDAPALTVTFAASVEVFHATPLPVTVQTLLAVVIVFAPPAAVANVLIDTAWPLESIVPFVSVIVRAEPTVKESANRQDPPTPLKLTLQLRVLPAQVMTRGVALVDANVVVFAPSVNVMPDDSVKLP